MLSDRNWNQCPTAVGIRTNRIAAAGIVFKPLATGVKKPFGWDSAKLDSLKGWNAKKAKISKAYQKQYRELGGN